MVRLPRLPSRKSIRKGKSIKDMGTKEIQDEINKILFSNKSKTKFPEKQLLEIIILRDKKRLFDFLDKQGGHTEWNVTGSWLDYPDEKNTVFQVEFRDKADEGMSKYLKNLFWEYNKRVVKEDLLYVRMTPVEVSSL